MTEYLSFFGGLNPANHKPTSPKTTAYNCIGWAANDSERWWEPSSPDLGYYWPPEAPQSMEVGSLVSAFETIGYATCSDGNMSSGMSKVAIYANHHGEWTHAARQLENGKWTSKLGELEDIEHDAAEAVAGEVYGSIYCFMGKST